MRKYHTHDLRISFVWFTECFYTEEEVQHHEKQKETHNIEVVLERFVADLKKKGILKENEALPSRLDLATLILQTYLHYPIENLNAVSVINYCRFMTNSPKNVLERGLNYILSAVC